MSSILNDVKETQVVDGKNQHCVECQYCKSKILLSKSADYITHEYQLPLITQKKQLNNQTNNVEFETLTEFWKVKDMYTFENVGFSNTVDNKKFLTCADCEMGPIGFHDLTTKESFVALSRVKHVEL